MNVKRPERVGLLIVRAWIEGPDNRLIARIASTLEVTGQPLRVFVVGTDEDVCAAVRDWLAGLRPSAAHPGDGSFTPS
jgi:hypothetical protein